MQDYKQEIQNTRIGCLGSSDGNLISQVASLGYVPPTAKKRLAVLKEFIPNEEIPYTDAVRAGDEMEMAIFENLSTGDNRYQSNPLLVSEKFSRKNVKLIDHPDIYLEEEDRKLITIYEVKTTKYDVETTRNNYRSQLYIHHLMAQEIAAKKGRGWRTRVALVHYDTNGLDLSQPLVFDPDRMTIREIKFHSTVFDIHKAMDILDEFLEKFDFYTEDEVIDAEYLPAPVKAEFADVARTLAEIKEREVKVEEFKKKLYGFLVEKKIKKVDCESFSFTVVEPTQSVTFDHKKYLADVEAKHPRVAKRLKEEFKKVTNKSGYVKISIK